MDSTILNPALSWQENLSSVLEQYLSEEGYEGEHVAKTPERFVKYLEHMVAGEDVKPGQVLGTVFPGEYDQLIHREGIRVVSTCKHHLVPIIGKAHFAYLPRDCIVGISKIPRLVRCFAQRLQVQEDLTESIVDAFQKYVKPKGCGIVIRAYHMCEIVRGVQEHAALTETTALRGCFKDNEQTRDEFLRSINRQETIFP